MPIERHDALIVTPADGFLYLRTTQGKGSKKLQQDASHSHCPKWRVQIDVAAFPQKMRLKVDIIRALVVTANTKFTPFQSKSTCRFSPLINQGVLFKARASS
ncbi:hypothetical protein [Rhizobium sp. R635]|uniref:hypothetical protein n=1 Tax=Rhizobium sp. R635 TaxID=1764275 RepID=UPI00167CC6CE|nr:hypothetical protein [Rhizobium sp. R635]